MSKKKTGEVHAEEPIKVDNTESVSEVSAECQQPIPAIEEQHAEATVATDRLVMGSDGSVGMLLPEPVFIEKPRINPYADMNRAEVIAAAAQEEIDAKARWDKMRKDLSAKIKQEQEDHAKRQRTLRLLAEVAPPPEMDFRNSEPRVE